MLAHQLTNSIFYMEFIIRFSLKFTDKLLNTSLITLIKLYFSRF